MTRVGAAYRAIGAAAASLPSESALLDGAGLVAHVYSTPLSEVLAMELRDLDAWARAAAALLRRLNGR